MGHKLFERFGVELEYMIVRKDNLEIAPVADLLFYEKHRKYKGEWNSGRISWSNELVLHVVELKTGLPESTSDGLSGDFHKSVREINALLEKEGCMLLPSACHPLMNPFLETRIWPHDSHEIYELYNRIFDCRGHGWSNVQSTHLNLSFSGDREFAGLHAAVRILLPLLPGLCASSPVLDGGPTGYMDSRMYHYQKNQNSMPIITGRVIPEAVFNRESYQSEIFDPINRALRPFDTQKILDQYFVNSRGAIARFDRGTIEIRVMDIQECPKADLAVVNFVTELLKMLTVGEWSSFREQASWETGRLYEIFSETVRYAEEAVLRTSGYPELFGVQESEASTIGDFWKILYQKIKDRLSAEDRVVIEHILNRGTLARRILNRLGEDFAEDRLRDVYAELSRCLAENRLFDSIASPLPLSSIDSTSTGLLK